MDSSPQVAPGERAGGGGAVPLSTSGRRAGRDLRAAEGSQAVIQSRTKRRQPKRRRKPVPGPQLARTVTSALCSARNCTLYELPQPFHNHAAALRRPGGLTKAAHASATSRALPGEQKRRVIILGDARWCEQSRGWGAAQGKAGAAVRAGTWLDSGRRRRCIDVPCWREISLRSSTLWLINTHTVVSHTQSQQQKRPLCCCQPGRLYQALQREIRGPRLAGTCCHCRPCVCAALLLPSLRLLLRRRQLAIGGVLCSCTAGLCNGRCRSRCTCCRLRNSTARSSSCHWAHWLEVLWGPPSVTHAQC